jgi:glycosyltransferase involved in cell wall biosynthesis
MKVAIVTPRYGDVIMGGAETGARMLGEQLAARRGDRVEVFSTNARNATTWAGELPAGTTTERGVVVHRFHVTGERHRHFDALTHRLLSMEEPSHDDQWEWIVAQGPVAPGLHEALVAYGPDVIVATPYLYHPTLHTMLDSTSLAAVPVVFFPAAHDEPVFHLSIFDDVFARANGFGWYTQAEREVAERSRPSIIVTPSEVVGLGIDVPEHLDDLGAGALPAVLDNRDYVVCLGRVDQGKGSDLLAELFIASQLRNDQPSTPLTLVFVGPIVHPPMQHPSIVTLGALDNDTKWAVLRHAKALINPSAYESFSLVVLEAWAAGIPVLVNARCAATLEHIAASGGGLWFDDLASFGAALDRLVDDEPLRQLLAGNGARYVRERFSWAAVITRVGALLERVVAVSRPIEGTATEDSSS